jgi:hypothetical protein
MVQCCCDQPVALDLARSQPIELIELGSCAQVIAISVALHLAESDLHTLEAPDVDASRVEHGSEDRPIVGQRFRCLHESLSE